jgi:hypothetical protein
MSRENAAEKARRIVAEGRLVLHRVDEDDGLAVGSVRGDAEIWNVGCDETGWWCSCQARGRCSHQLAVGLVVAVGRRG